MNIDTSKLYPVKLVFVKPYFRTSFKRPSLLFKVEIPEGLTSTTRTLNLPKTLDRRLAKPRCKFQQVIGPILEKVYPDELLSNLNRLAKQLDADLSGKMYLAYLSESKDGNYIDLVSLQEKLEKAA